MRDQNRPNIIDIEASGFGAMSYPIEVGIILNNNHKYCSLIKPHHDWTHWDAGAQKIHGIERESLQQHGRPVTEVASTLNHILGGLTVYSDGWVVDKPWLIRLYHAARMDMTFTISPIELILNEAQMSRWNDSRNRIIRNCEFARHRASTDAWIIQETYYQTYQA